MNADKACITARAGVDGGGDSRGFRTNTVMATRFQSKYPRRDVMQRPAGGFCQFSLLQYTVTRLWPP